MALDFNQRSFTKTADQADIDEGLRAYMLKVYNYMTIGLETKNNFQNNWVDFYREKRLYYIFNLINNFTPYLIKKSHLIFCYG